MSHVGGNVETVSLDASLTRTLEHALDVDADEGVTNAHVHGFHSYPARLHPTTAARLIEGLSKPGDRLLDPFCGSGTVLVEARLAGRFATGIDANPLAIELAWLKTRGFSSAERGSIQTAAEAVCAHADARRITRAGPSRPYAPIDRELFEPHTLLELDGLRTGIRTVSDTTARRVLSLVLSSLLTKLSRQPGDTADERRRRRLPAGHAFVLFQRKTTELLERLVAFEERLPAQAPPAIARIGDARHLTGIPARSIDVVITSPPYPGVYDYHRHHATRLRWLELEAHDFERAEVGSRRRLDHLPFARALGGWERDLGACLRAMARVLAANGAVALVLADTALANRPVFADETVRRISAGAGFCVVAKASQRRPHFHRATRHVFRARPRREHVLVLGRREPGS